MSDPKPLTATSAVITGAGSGIGRAVAVRFASLGCQQHIIDTDYDGMVETERLCAEVTGDKTIMESVYVRPADVTDPKAVDAVFTKAEFSFALENVVHCAGVRGGGPFHQMSMEEWHRVIETNLTGTMVVCQRAIEGMVRQDVKGSIVVVSSMTGMIANGPGFHNAHYAASKAGVNGLVKALAIEYAPYGIRVNAVCPGPVVTPMTDAFRERNPKLYNEFFGRIPLGPGHPDDVARAVEYLTFAPWVTGSLLVVDGGYTAQ